MHPTYTSGRKQHVTYTSGREQYATYTSGRKQALTLETGRKRQKPLVNDGDECTVKCKHCQTVHTLSQQGTYKIVLFGSVQERLYVQFGARDQLKLGGN